MKDKILFLIIGILIGAIIATGGFLIYNNVSDNNQSQPGMMQMDENGRGMKQFDGNMNEIPTKPDGEADGEMPAMPDGEMSTEDSNSESNS